MIHLEINDVLFFIGATAIMVAIFLMDDGPPYA